MGIVNKWGIP